MDVYGQKFISIVADDTFVFKKKPYKWATKLNRAIGAQNLNLLVGLTNVDEHELTELIRSLTKAEKKDRNKIIQAFEIKKNRFLPRSFLKTLLYVFISIALLLLFLTGITAIMTIMIIMGLAAITARWYWGSTEKSWIRKYAEIITLLGLINMFLGVATLKTYEYVSENAGIKLTTQLEEFKIQHSTYPTDFQKVMKNTELNAIEKIFVRSVHYKLMGDNYELTTITLLNNKKKYDQELKKWN